MKKSSFKEKFMHYLGAEVWIEYKACLYSYCMMVFYCIFLLCRSVYQARILIMAEMVIVAYFMGYVQVYLLKNFDESDKLGKHEIVSTLLCCFSYTLISYVLDWFGRSLLATGLFFLFMLFSFVCVCLVNRIRRAYDTQNLNKMLSEFKKRESGHGKGD